MYIVHAESAAHTTEIIICLFNFLNIIYYSQYMHEYIGNLLSGYIFFSHSPIVIKLNDSTFDHYQIVYEHLLESNVSQKAYTVKPLLVNTIFGPYNKNLDIINTCA